MMKYKRGSIVEVFVKNEFCVHSWRCAEIVSGNRGRYTVSYDVYPGFTNMEDVECVSLRSIRPCPPLLEVAECWVPGDVVEVFHNLSWNMAVVLNDFGLDQFQVRLVGSSQELQVANSELRVRQSYQNGKWIVIGKVTEDDKDANYTKDTEEDFCKKDLCFDTHNNHPWKDSHVVSSKTLKRACYYSQGETNEGRAQKFRKEGNCKRVPGTLPVKVDAVDYSREIIHYDKDLDTMKENINEIYGSEFESSRALTLDDDDTYSVASSSGSCSINSYRKPYEFYYGSGPVEDIEGCESDAESVCQSGYNEEIHRLELHAYRCTMEALHALGPLTWENETMVTNLRMSLHISNDEHLIMLKNLISAASNTLTRRS